MDIDAKNLKQRYAELHEVPLEEVEERFKDKTAEDILKEIKAENLQRIQENIHLNRAQRRKLQKKAKKNNMSYNEAITDTAEKLNYIDLIQKLRALNEQKEKENIENDATKDN